MDLTISRDEWPTIISSTTGHLLAYGWPGTGKSHDFSVYAERFALTKRDTINLNRAKDGLEPLLFEHEEVNCTRQTSAAGWLGHWIDGGPAGFIWNDGPVSRAMKNGVPVVINDVHLCSDDLFDLLFFVLDTRAGAKYSLPNGTHLKATPGFRGLLSMNGLPEQILDEPIRDRLLAKFEINTPSREALRALDPDVRKFCRYLYQNAKSEPPKFTYRTYQSFCTLRKDLGDPFKAARLACGDEEAARAFIEPMLVVGS